MLDLVMCGTLGFMMYAASKSPVGSCALQHGEHMLCMMGLVPSCSVIVLSLPSHALQEFYNLLRDNVAPDSLSMYDDRLSRSVAAIAA